MPGKQLKTQAALAAALGVTPRTVCGWVNSPEWTFGRRGPFVLAAVRTWRDEHRRMAQHGGTSPKGRDALQRAAAERAAAERSGAGSKGKRKAADQGGKPPGGDGKRSGPAGKRRGPAGKRKGAVAGARKRKTVGGSKAGEGAAGRGRKRAVPGGSKTDEGAADCLDDGLVGGAAVAPAGPAMPGAGPAMQAADMAVPGAKTPIEQDLSLKAAREEKVRLEIAITRGEYVPRPLLDKALAGVTDMYLRELEQMVQGLPPRMQGCEACDIERMLDDRVQTVRDRLAAVFAAEKVD